MGGPTLEDFTDIVCPAERPNKCAPFAVCCGYDEFCSRLTETCEPCFTSRQGDNPLEWCRTVGLTNVSAWPHPTCRFACRDRFNDTQLQGYYPGICFDVSILAILIFIILLLLVAVIALSVWRCNQRQDKTVVQVIKTDGDGKHDAAHTTAGPETEDINKASLAKAGSVSRQQYGGSVGHMPGDRPAGSPGLQVTLPDTATDPSLDQPQLPTEQSSSRSLVSLRSSRRPFSYPPQSHHNFISVTSTSIERGPLDGNTISMAEFPSRQRERQPLLGHGEERRDTTSVRGAGSGQHMAQTCGQTPKPHHLEL